MKYFPKNIWNLLIILLTFAVRLAKKWNFLVLFFKSLFKGLGNTEKEKNKKNFRKYLEDVF